MMHLALGISHLAKMRVPPKKMMCKGDVVPCVPRIDCADVLGQFLRRHSTTHIAKRLASKCTNVADACDVMMRLG